MLVESRIEDLKDNILQDLDLLKEYEEALRYEGDPRRKGKYLREIERQKESIERYQQEYEKLQSQVVKEPAEDKQVASDQLQQVHSMLITLESKLNDLQSGQAAVLDKLDAQHQEVLARFNDSDQTIVASVIKHLDETQLDTVKSVLAVVEANRIPDEEIKGMIESIRPVLTEIQQQEARLSNPQMAKEAASISKVFDDPKIESSHKLKLSIPIIPLLLSYEGDIALKGGMNLRSAWQCLKAKVMG